MASQTKWVKNITSISCISWDSGNPLGTWLDVPTLGVILALFLGAMDIECGWVWMLENPNYEENEWKGWKWKIYATKG